MNMSAARIWILLRSFVRADFNRAPASRRPQPNNKAGGSRARWVESGDCGVRRPCPGRGAAGSVGPDLAFAPQLLQGEPDRLVADAGQRRPDVGKAERGGRVAQDVLADALLLRPRGPCRGGAISED